MGEKSSKEQWYPQLYQLHGMYIRGIPFFYPRPLPKDGGFYYTEEGSDFFIKEAAKKSSPLIVFSKGAAKNQP